MDSSAGGISTGTEGVIGKRRPGETRFEDYTVGYFLKNTAKLGSSELSMEYRVIQNVKLYVMKTIRRSTLGLCKGEVGHC